MGPVVRCNAGPGRRGIAIRREGQIPIGRLVLLWILLELVGALQVRAPAGGTRLASWVRFVGDPIVVAAGGIASAVGGAVELTVGAVDLELEARRLRAEVARLRSATRLLDEDLAAMREAVDLVELYDPSAPPVLGRVAYRDLSAGRMELRLAQGRAAPKDAAVIAADGVLGRVVGGGYRSCWVELLLHPAAAVAVRTSSSGVEGLAVGDGSTVLAVEFIPRTAAILRGEMLVTSGADGVFPPGLPVARVTGVRESDTAFLEITAEPAADPRDARVALVLAGWRPTHGGSP